MKLPALLTLGVAASTMVLAAIAPDQVPLNDAKKDELPEKFLIELAPGDTRWVTEDEKWELKREGLKFFDITAEVEQGFLPKVFPTPAVVNFPSELNRTAEVKQLASQLSKENMFNHLTNFTSFHTRYYKSTAGTQSATWLFEQVQQTVNNSLAVKYGAKVETFNHSWSQFSIIASIPGRTNKTVVVGAHQDSINMYLPTIMSAPGADDDGSGTVTILEALRVLLQSDAVAQGNATNTIEFHWYSAEEAGLLGSQAVFSKYKNENRDIKSMLQQDMTGYSQGTLDAGEQESVGVITDYVHSGLTEFIMKVVTGYCDIPFVLTKCGYACSDHASASRYGYPSAFVIESKFEHSSQRIHTMWDTVEYLDFDHMLQHAKMTLGLVYELAFAEL
ncbi:leucine aminopeptidase 1 [Paracoccidioides brasiliensis]|uniref:Peptide hydrolase n=1 Tax=Paracoccidioides brasiliensis TaxID=121759 RepID=A0A1D2J4J1_PARBR|nr:leucine aminopeptidase 1 [Paracoccidioides brasiliensis]ODH46404.1 leucine aminopeptidase 1 [Paracoccidioides brasiliensis]